MIWFAIGAVASATLSGMIIGAVSGKKLFRVVALMLCTAGAFTAGMMWEKAGFVNRHIDMCHDETSRYFREYGELDPYCEVLKDG